MTRRKRMIRFEADWSKHHDYGHYIAHPHGDVDVLVCCPLGKRIIRALGRKEGKIRITLERVE